MENFEKFDYLVKKYNLIKTALRTRNECIASVSETSLIVLGYVACIQSNTIRIANGVMLDPANEILFCGWKIFTNASMTELDNHMDMIIKQYKMCLKEYKDRLVNQKIDDLQQDFQ